MNEVKHAISALHCITWDGAGIGHLEQVKALVAAGADWIQLRQKSGDPEQRLAIAREAVQICRGSGVVLIVNDDVAICRESHAHGVHLGLQDMPVAQARAMLGPQYIIGGTANTPQQVLQRWDEGVDYVGLGPWRHTGTKANLSALLGPTGVAAALQALQNRHAHLPVVVIGGITPSDVAEIRALGAHGIAVSSAVVAAPSIADAHSSFRQALACSKISLAKDKDNG